MSLASILLSAWRETLAIDQFWTSEFVSPRVCFAREHLMVQNLCMQAIRCAWLQQEYKKMPYLQKEHCRCENLFSPSYQLYRSFSSPSCLFSSLPFNRFAGYSFFICSCSHQLCITWLMVETGNLPIVLKGEVCSAVTYVGGLDSESPKEVRVVGVY